MDEFTIVISIIGVIGTISSFIFAYIACHRTNIKDEKKEAKNEGAMLSDIGYIKACVDRVEKNLNKVDERYRNIVERLVKVEESLANVIKRVDEL